MKETFVTLAKASKICIAPRVDLRANDPRRINLSQVTEPESAVSPIYKFVHVLCLLIFSSFDDFS